MWPGGPEVLKSWDRPGQQAFNLKRSMGKSVWGWRGECRRATRHKTEVRRELRDNMGASWV